MPKVVVVEAEGVLCRRDGQNAFQANQPIGPGMDLIASLDAFYNVAVVAGETDRDEVRRWLVNHGMGQHFSYVVERTPTMPEARPERFLAQVALLRSMGFAIGMVVTSDPATTAMAHAQGYTCLLFTHPAYARPEWRPDDDRGVRSWAEIEADIEHQAQLKAKDTRVLTDATDGRFSD